MAFLDLVYIQSPLCMVRFQIAFVDAGTDVFTENGYWKRPRDHAGMSNTELCLFSMQ